MLLLIRRFVECVGRSIWKMKTSIGVVERIDLSMEARCGGVVERLGGTLMAANTLNMSAKTMKMTLRMLRNGKMRNYKRSDVCVAKALVTK